MKDLLFDQIVSKWQEVVDLPPQKLGVFTPLYKRFTRILKKTPIPILFIVSVGLVLGIFFLLGPATIYIVELLQRGF